MCTPKVFSDFRGAVLSSVSHAVVNMRSSLKRPHLEDESGYMMGLSLKRAVFKDELVWGWFDCLFSWLVWRVKVCRPVVL